MKIATIYDFFVLKIHMALFHILTSGKIIIYFKLQITDTYQKYMIYFPSMDKFVAEIYFFIDAENVALQAVARLHVKILL